MASKKDFSPTLLALGLACGPLASNGLGRFAYGLVLPDMQRDLGWSYAEAGALNAANALGYFAGAVLTLILISRHDPGRLFRAGLVLTILSMLVMPMLRDPWALGLARFLAGLGGAPTFIAGGALAAALGSLAPHRSALLIAIYFAGIGVGLLMSGLALPPYLAVFGSGHWPGAWLAMGLACLVALFPAWGASRAISAPAPPSLAESRWPWRSFAYAFWGYGFYAAGYVIYITFLVAWMRSAGAGAGLVMLVWGVMGAAVIVAPFVWRPVMGRWSGRSVFAASILFTGVGSGAALLPGGLVTLLASALIYGLAFIITPSAIGAMARENLPQPQWGSALAGFTIIFSGLQTIGPILSGALADLTGSLADGLLLGTALLFVGAALAYVQPARIKPGA